VQGGAQITYLASSKASEIPPKHPKRQAPQSPRNPITQVEGTLQLFEQLKGQHQDVASKSKALHDSCELLVAEKDRLVEFADALRDKLSYFDELDSLSAKFHSASLAVESEDFLPILRRLDECIA